MQKLSKTLLIYIIYVMYCTTKDAKELRVRFDVPKKLYGNSNARNNDRQKAMMSAKLRNAIAPPVWETAIRKQFGITALEPTDWDHPKRHETNTEARTREEMEDQTNAVNQASRQVEELTANIAGLKDELKVVRKQHGNVDAIRSERDEAESRLKEAKAGLRSESKLLTRCRNAYRKAVSRNDRRISTADHKAYLKAKAELNKDRMLFPGTVFMMVRSNIITNHDFDAPNCWPILKPLQDGGTDTGILWRDDNNRIIKWTTFYGGCRASRDFYVLEVKVVELSPDPNAEFIDPFGPKLDTITETDKD